MSAIDMGNDKISKLVWKVSLPMVFSVISIALYGIIDTIFVSQMKDGSLTAISLIYPIQNTITAISLGLSIGLNSLLAKSLGNNDADKSKKIMGIGIKLTIISWLITAVIFALFTNKIISFFTKDIILINLGTTYLKIIGVFSIGAFFQVTIEKILEAHGKTKDSMIIQLLGCIINLVLDPILIFGIGNFKGIGIKGAAIATVIGQFVGMIYGIFLIKKYKYINLSEIYSIKLSKEIVKDIYKVGLPTTILEILSSFIMMIINKLLININTIAVDVWGIYIKIQKFIFIIVYGFNYGMIPILAFNIGAKNIERVSKCLKYFIKISICVTGIGMFVFLLIPAQIMNWFNVTEQTIELGVIAFRILSLGFIFAGISLVLSAFFQSFGNGTYSLIVNLSRKIIFVLPIILLFKNVLGVNIVWWAFTISEVIAFIIAFVLYKIAFNNLEKNN